MKNFQKKIFLSFLMLKSVAYNVYGIYEAATNHPNYISGEMLLSTRTLDVGVVTSMEFSHNRKYIASGYADGTIKLWSLDTLQCIHQFKKISAYISSIAFSPDGKYLASLTLEGIINLWNIETNECIQQFIKESPGTVFSVMFNNDGKCIASVCLNGTINLWDPETNKYLHKLSPNPKVNFEVLFPTSISPDGKCLAFGRSNGTIELWNLETHQCTYISAFCTGLIAFSPNGKRLACVCAYGCILLWDLETNTRLHQFPNRPGLVKSIAFSHDATQIFVASSNGLITMAEVFN